MVKKQCVLCLESKRRYRKKYRERENEKSKEYYKQNQEERNKKHNLKSECPLCKCMVRKYAMNRHEESQKHQLKLTNLNQPKIISNEDDETGIMGI